MSRFLSEKFSARGGVISPTLTSGADFATKKAGVFGQNFILGWVLMNLDQKRKASGNRFRLENQ